MNNYLRKFENNHEDNFFNQLFNQLTSEEVSTMLRTDIKETESNYIIETEVPGLKKEDIKISLDHNYLTIIATRKEEKDEKENNKYLHKERFTGTYKRSFYVGEINKESISAKFENGILTITLAKEDPKVTDSKHIIEIN